MPSAKNRNIGRADTIKVQPKGWDENKKIKKYMHTHTHTLVISGKEVSTPFCIYFCIIRIT